MTGNIFGSDKRFRISASSCDFVLITRTEKKLKIMDNTTALLVEEFEKIDKDKDGLMTIEEMKAWYTKTKQPWGAINDKLFAALDKNSDNKINVAGDQSY